MLAAAAALEAVPAGDRRQHLRERGPEALAEAGFSWERLSGWLPGGMDAEAWENDDPDHGSDGACTQPAQFRPGRHLRKAPSRR